MQDTISARWVNHDGKRELAPSARTRALASQLMFHQLFPDRIPRVDTRTPADIASGMTIDQKMAARPDGH